MERGRGLILKSNTQKGGRGVIKLLWCFEYITFLNLELPKKTQKDEGEHNCSE